MSLKDIQQIGHSRPVPEKGQAPDRAKEQWPLKTHQYAKFLREVKGYTWIKLSEEIGVPTRTLQIWGEKECWGKKGSEAKQIEDYTRQKFLELTAANGMPKAKAAQLLIEGMTEPAIEKEEPAIIDSKGKVLQSAKVTKAPDYTTRHKYQKDYWVLAGLYSTSAGGTANIDARGAGTVNIQVNIPEKQQIEEK